MKKKTNHETPEGIKKIDGFREFLMTFSKKNLIWLMLFSLLLCTCFFTYINIFIDKILPEDEVVVTISGQNADSQGSEVWIYLINNSKISQEQFSAMEKSGEWGFRSAEEWGYENNTILGGTAGSSLTIPVKRSSGGGISIWCQAYSGIIDVEAGGKTEQYDLFSEKGSYIQITPFEDSFLSVVVTIFVYVIFTCMMTALFLLAMRVLRNIYTDYKEPQYKYWMIVLIIFIGTYIFDVIWYRIGIVNFNAFGDQPSYWAIGGVFAQVGVTREAIIETMKSLPCIRGYGIFLPSFIAQFIGNRIHVDPYMVYFLLPSLTSAFLFGYILPKIYEVIHGRKVCVWQILFAFFGFMIFYRGNLVSIDGDLFGLAFYLAGALFGMLIFRTGKMKYAIGSGVCFSLCLAIRTSYLIGVIVLLVLMVILAALNFRGKITKNSLFLFAEISVKRITGMVIAFSISFICVCAPQIFINELKGHRGLFAYDQDGVYGTETTTLLEAAADTALKGMLTGYPYEIYDAQVHSIRKAAGYRDEKEMTMAQSFDAYSRSPLDTLVAIVKRAFVMVDIKCNVTLPDEGWYAHTKYYLFSTINYIFIATALFTLLNKRLRQLLYQKMDFLFWGAVLIGPVAPWLASKIEWREAMVEYLFYIGYICAFCFAGSIYDKERRQIIRESNYLPALTCTVLALHAVSLTMYH